MYLITKWFGSFLLDDKGIKKKILFNKNEEEILKKLKNIRENKVLAEERKIIESQDKDKIIVNESRLSDLGIVDNKNPFFKKVEINPSDFNYPEGLLQKGILNLTKNEVKNNLETIDLQVIQMIDTVDDFIHIQNLLNERYNTWSEIKTSKDRMSPLIDSISELEKDIKKLQNKIGNDMEKIAPNLSEIVGPLIGARLISYAGSLKKLALLPSSTIQVLGAEKALFRFKKQGGKPPKHGIIFQLSEINRAPRSKRGKIARTIANKISVAVRADAFTNNVVSDQIKKEIKEKISEIRNN